MTVGAGTQHTIQDLAKYCGLLYAVLNDPIRGLWQVGCGFDNLF